MKLTMSPLWPVLIIGLGSIAYGWKGAFWSTCAFFFGFMMMGMIASKRRLK